MLNKLHFSSSTKPANRRLIVTIKWRFSEIGKRLSSWKGPFNTIIIGREDCEDYLTNGAV